MNGLGKEFYDALDVLDEISNIILKDGFVTSSDIFSRISNDLISDSEYEYVYAEFINYLAFGSEYDDCIKEVKISDSEITYYLYDMASVFYSLSIINPVFSLLFKNSYVKLFSVIQGIETKTWAEIIEDMAKYAENRLIKQKDYHTYILKDGAGLYKIGKSADIHNRICNIQRHNPTATPVLLIASDIEKHLHLQYDCKKIHGEWFELSDDDIISIYNKYYDFVYAKYK